MQARRERIQRLFKKKMGLIIDAPKPGYGKTTRPQTMVTQLDASFRTPNYQQKLPVRESDNCHKI